MLFLIKQGLVLMLPVDIDERTGQFPKGCCGDRLPVYAADTAAAPTLMRGSPEEMNLYVFVVPPSS